MEPTTEPTTENADLLVFEENLVPADGGKRFVNYLIDLIFFYVVVAIIGAVIGILSPATIDSISDSPGFGLGDRILSLFLYGLYMSIIEGLFKGKSLGKLITKTRAVNWDGSPISWSTAFGRGFSKAVPFCAFSAFGTPCNPWQDRWTSTMVIDERYKINA